MRLLRLTLLPHRWAGRLLLVAALALASCAPAAPATPAPGIAAAASAVPTPPATPITPTVAPTPSVSPTPVITDLIGAGDIASCASHGDEDTALLLDAHVGTVFTLGDNAYESGSAEEFARCFVPSWGRHRGRIRPAAGNHDYRTASAAGYFQYFGTAAGDPRLGYYSYDLGAWHVVVLNSNCDFVGGCHAGSPQERWLREDLARHAARCTLAYWHHPRFSSGQHGSDRTFTAIWRALYDAGVELALTGHDHHYERFAPQDPDGRADPQRGIRQFVVGTGGASLRTAGPPIANSEVLRDDTFGVLKLTLLPGGYRWAFIVTLGSDFSDTGSGTCH